MKKLAYIIAFFALLGYAQTRYLHFYDDKYESSSIEGTWSVEGDVLTMQVYDDEVMEYTVEIDGDTLILTDDDGVAKLTRVK